MGDGQQVTVAADGEEGRPDGPRMRVGISDADASRSVERAWTVGEMR